MDGNTQWSIIHASIIVYTQWSIIHTSIDGTHNGVSFSLKKEGQPADGDGMKVPGGHYPKWIKPVPGTSTAYAWDLKQKASLLTGPFRPHRTGKFHDLL